VETNIMSNACAAEQLIWDGRLDEAKRTLADDRTPEASRMRAIAALYEDDLLSATIHLYDGTSQGDEVCEILLKQIKEGKYVPLRKAADASAS
jgi:hypothetical protein